MVHPLARLHRLPDRAARRQRSAAAGARAHASTRLRPAAGDKSSAARSTTTAKTDSTAVAQAAAATALFTGALGAGGYATRRDLSFLYRFLFWLLLGLGSPSGSCRSSSTSPAARPSMHFSGWPYSAATSWSTSTDSTVPQAMRLFLWPLESSSMDLQHFLFFLQLFGASLTQRSSSARGRFTRMDGRPLFYPTASGASVVFRRRGAKAYGLELSKMVSEMTTNRP